MRITPLLGDVIASSDVQFLVACVFLSSHASVECISREVSAISHGDRCNDDPRSRAQREVIGHEGPSAV